MDFKGYFATGDGKRCDPFTITDAYSRYLIRCQIVSRMDLSQVRAISEAAMREFGVPARIRTDNGAPFAGTGLLGLSKLSLSWMKLGIVHERNALASALLPPFPLVGALYECPKVSGLAVRLYSVRFHECPPPLSVRLRHP
jgi:hypothetical protein